MVNEYKSDLKGESKYLQKKSSDLNRLYRSKHSSLFVVFIFASIT